jgi:hypothetical protein
MFPSSAFHIVSLGTGTTKPKDFDPTLATVAGLLSEIITDTRRRADDFGRHWNSNNGHYFRFSPPFLGDIGLDESSKLEEIRRLAIDYIDDYQTGRQFADCAMKLAEPVGESLIEKSVSTDAAEQSVIERSHELSPRICIVPGYSYSIRIGKC